MKVSVPVPKALLVMDPTAPLLATPANNTPLVSVVPPLYVFAPLKVSVPVPLLLLNTKATVFVPSWITPPNDPGFAPAIVSVALLEPLFVTTGVPPVLFNEAIVWLYPARSSVPPDMLIADADTSVVAEELPSFSVPALIVVVPVYVFTPVRVHVPEPLWVNAVALLD